MLQSGDQLGSSCANLRRLMGILVREMRTYCAREYATAHQAPRSRPEGAEGPDGGADGAPPDRRTSGLGDV